jgi:hypothetical protein
LTFEDVGVLEPFPTDSSMSPVAQMSRGRKFGKLDVCLYLAIGRRW